MSEPSNSLVQNNLNNRARGIKAEQANDMKHITRYTQDPAVLDLRTAQPSMCPDHHVVGQRAKQHQHLLRLRALLRAFGQTQSPLVAFHRGFDVSTALIVEGHIGDQDRHGISRLRTGVPQHREHLLDRANIASRGFGHPAKRALGPVRILDPLGDRFGQAQHSLPRILFRHDLIASSKQLIEVIQGPGIGIHADHRPCPFRLVQLQGGLSRLHQRLQGLDQLDIARKEAINDHFLILGGQHAAQLPSPAVILSGKIALGGKSGFGAALLYSNQGKHEQAEPLYQRTLAFHEQALGPDHPNTVAILNNLASFYNKQGKYEQAELLYQRALAISEQAPKPNYIDTLNRLYNLVDFYEKQSEYERAEPFHQRALAIREKKLGAEHPETRIVPKNYTDLLQKIKAKREQHS